MNSTIARAVAALVVCVCLILAGFAAGRYSLRAAWEAERVTWTKTERDAAQAAAATLARALAAEQQNDELAARALAAESAARLAGKEKRNAIRALASGRVALSGELTRLLNESTALHQSAAVAATGGIAGKNPAPATDTDVALWIHDTRAAHDTCRARIDALRCWRDRTAGKQSPDCPQ